MMVTVVMRFVSNLRFLAACCLDQRKLEIRSSSCKLHSGTPHEVCSLSLDHALGNSKIGRYDREGSVKSM